MDNSKTGSAKSGSDVPLQLSGSSDNDAAIVFDDELEDANDEMGTESHAGASSVGASLGEERSAGVYEVDGDEEEINTGSAKATAASLASSFSAMDTSNNTRRSSRVSFGGEGGEPDPERAIGAPPSHVTSTAAIANNGNDNTTLTGSTTTNPNNHIHNGTRNKSAMTIQHTAQSREETASRSSPSFLCCITKPVAIVLVVIAFLLMVTTGSVFFSQLPAIRGLDDQIDVLESEVDLLQAQLGVLQRQIDLLEAEVTRLGETVDQLTTENDRFAESNAVLVVENEQLVGANEQLAASNAQLETQITNLNVTTQELDTQVGALAEENLALRVAAGSLNETIDLLVQDVEDLQDSNAALDDTNAELVSQVQRIEDEMSDLDKTNTELETTNRELNGQVEDLDSQNQELQSQVDRMEALLSFLDDNVGANSTFDDAVKTLEDLVEVNRDLVLQSLENKYQTIDSIWFCDFETDFTGYPFILLPDRPIGETEYNEVIASVARGALNPLCLDEANFEDYVNSFVFGLPAGSPAPTQVSTNELRTSVGRYSQLALNYYFPDEVDVGNGEGLTPQDWTSAQYDCRGLSEEKEYRWNGFVFSPSDP